MKLEYKTLVTPVGKMLLVADATKLLCFSWEPIDTFEKGADLKKSSTNKILCGAEDQVKAYFNRKIKTFSLPLELRGTDFQQRVWAELRKIPYGKAISYGEQARRIGNPKAMRAVGSANGRNPIAIIVPCHRVIGTDGKLSGFGGGVRAKEFLLSLENVKIN